MKKCTFGMLVLAVLVSALPATAIDPNCTADIFTNGVVDSFDVLTVVSDMGCSGALCVGDVNGNGIVGPLDLARVLANLGDCPCIGDVDLSGGVDAADLTATTAAIFSYCPDIDGNGVVDGTDEFIVLASFTALIPPQPDAVPEADLDGDGDIDADDFTIVTAAAGMNCRTDVDFSLVVDVSDAAIVGGSVGSTCP